MNARQLKNALLQQAIEGRLVPQNPDDEPAAVLLQRIRAEKARLIEDGRIKKQKPLPPITDEEKPFPIPASWEWVRLGEVILENVGGGTPDKLNPKYWGGTIPWASVKDLHANRLYKTQDYITEEGLQNSSARILKKGTIIICTRMALGKITIADIDVAINQDLRGINLSDFIDKYFFIYMYGTLSIEGSGVTVKGIRIESLHNKVIPLPPLEEQKRIVAKLEELLPEVEEYGRAQEELNALETALPGRLRKSLLQEAVEGRLVPQNPDDEPAAVLLQRIRAEKARLIEDGRIKKQKPLPPITDEEKPFPIPASWEWVRLGEVILENVGGGTPDKLNPKYWGGTIPWASVKDLHANRLYKTQDYITEEGLQNSSARILKKGTIIICTRMALGKITIADIDVAINQDLRGITLSNLFDKEFFIYLYSTLSIKGSGVTVKGIRIENLHNKLIPLPPLEEQKRIVAKLEEVLPLCAWGEGATSEPPAGQDEPPVAEGE